MLSFKKYKLGHLYNVSSGLSKPRDQFGFGYPFVTFRDVFYNYFLPDKLSELANTTDREIRSCSVKKGDIFLTRTSETMDELGMSSVALKDYPNATFNGFTKRLRLKAEIDIDIDPVFIGYYFRTNEVRNQIGSHASMTTRASLNSTAINSIEVSIPEIGKQISIGKILKALDDKIELNRQMNHTLEQMAQTLFKKYFVTDIDPDNLPDGWRKASLSEFMDFEGGMQPPASEFISHPAEGYIRLIQIRDYESDSNITYVPISSRLRLTSKKEIMIARYGASVARICYGLDGAYNVALVKVKPVKSIYLEFLRSFLKSTDCQERIINMSYRSVQAGFNKDDFKSIMLPVPISDTIFVDYESQVSCYIDKILQNREENSGLEQIRDVILPKLMNGEIELN